MAYIYDIADTWAASGTTFTGIKLSVTDTASAAGSLLMDLQVGGVSQFSVRKDGAIAVKEAQFIGTGISMTGGSGVTGMALISTYTLGWVSNTAQSFTTPDLRLARDAANTLAQRNGVNAQAFNLYNTYTDASNYERGFMRFVSNVLQIGGEAAGTGTGRSLLIKSGLAASGQVRIGSGLVTLDYEVGFSAAAGGNVLARLYPLENNVLRLLGVTGGDGVGGALQFTEMTAPAAASANSVRIYAEDNGSGKTRLMALFATGVAQQIAIEP